MSGVWRGVSFQNESWQEADVRCGIGSLDVGVKRKRKRDTHVAYLNWYEPHYMPDIYFGRKRKRPDKIRPLYFLERETRFELATSTLARLHSTAELFPQMEAASRFELENKGFADLCLTTWLCRLYLLERETRFELATSTLARLHSTAELFPLNRVNHLAKHLNCVKKKRTVRKKKYGFKPKLFRDLEFCCSSTKMFL